MSEPGVMSIGQCASLACLMEVTAPKVGNVHRGADFEDMTYWDFVVSANTIGPIMDAAPRRSLGETVLAAVQATRRAVGVNTNLGTVLLLTPLCMVPRGEPLHAGVRKVLDELTRQDAQAVYAAIRHAQPGGMGTAERHDLAGDAPGDLIEAMREAADRDLVARQYTEGFSDVLDRVVPWLSDALTQGKSLSDAIVEVQLRLMAACGDSLIARKCGDEVAHEASGRATAVLERLQQDEDAYRAALADFDFWLRSDGHRRNPGTTADLLAAGLFVGLRKGVIGEPYRMTFGV
jgi:triphosphoribosyl-dephospho-CoA synthase